MEGACRDGGRTGEGGVRESGIRIGEIDRPLAWAFYTYQGNDSLCWSMDGRWYHHWAPKRSGTIRQSFRGSSLGKPRS